MDPTVPAAFARLARLPPSLPAEGAVRIELEDGYPVFRASAYVQERVATLIDRQREGSLTEAEAEELDLYEALHDHVSLINRIARNAREG